MLYDAYTKKVQRLVLFLRKVFKNIVPISIVTGVIVVATIACLLSVGTITTGVECPSELVYGQTVDHSAKAFMADVQYEYSLAGSDEWTTTLPIEPGNYLVRAVSTNIFGSKTYSEEKSFVLNKKQIEVKVAESTMVYGGELSVTAGLVAGDSIQCKDFVFADATAANTQVNAVAGSVVIINKDGKDVTSSYDILTPASSISIAPRPLQLTIHGNEDVYYYNGIALRYGGYEVNEGTPLVDGDEIRVSYESRYQQTNAGEFTVNDENEPELSFKVLNKDGFDVSGHYDMSAVWGTLKVDQKVIGVTAQGKVFVYDGTEKTFDQLNSGYVVDDEIISLLESLGHTLRVKNPGSLSVLNAGDKKPNLLDFEIVDADNNDVTSNYSFLYIDSENVYIEMTVRPVQITLEDSEKIYDGIEIDRSFEIFETDNNGEKKKVTGTTLKAGDNASSLKFDLATVPGYKIVVDVNGTRTNVQSLSSADNDTYSVNWYVEDASGNKVNKSNFDITGSDLEATLKINPRPITITLTNFTKEYDGIALNRAYKVTEKDNSGKVINVAEVTLDADDVASELSHALATVEGQNIVIDVVGARTNVELLTASDSDTYTVVYRVVDAGGNAIDLSNFDFGASDLEATLKITPKALSVTTGGAQKIYDGTPLVNDEIEVVGLISSEHFAERRNSYTQVVNVTAGADNAITHADLLITDAAGLDITSNYSLDQSDVTCGSLEITKRNIYITALDLNKTYDGKPLSGQFSADQLELIKNALNADEEYGKNNCVDGEKVYFFAETALGDLNGKEHRIEIINESSVTNATAEDVVNKIGNSEGVLAVITEVTLNPDGSIASEVDVSANYSISAEDGSLSIDKKVISIKARDERRLYNGAPLQSTGIDVMFGEQLAENHSFADFEFEGSQTDVGTFGTSTIVDYDIVDADGNTVLDNYIIENEYTGELRVLAGMVTIQLISKDKIYDGSPLTCEYNVICVEYDTETEGSKKTVYKGKLAGEPTDFNNCTLTPQFTGIGETGDIINVEKIYWTIDLGATTLVDAEDQEIDRNNIDIDVAYVDEEGNEISGVTSAYLNIEKRPIQITLSDSDKMYDGIALDRFFQINESDNGGNTIPVADKAIGSNDNASEIEFPLATVPGYKIVVSLSGTRTNVKVSSDNGDDATYSIDWDVIDPEGNIVSKDNFDLSGSDLEANFSVSKRPIQITLSDSDKMYDGIALDRFFQINESDNGGNTIPVADKTIGSNDKASEIEFPLATVPGYKIVVTLSGTRTNVNVNSANGDDATYSIDWDVIDPEGNIVSKDNFDLSGSDLEANFSVSKRPITINLYADDKIYDGNYVDRYYEIVVSDAVKDSVVSKTKLTSGDETYGIEYAIECMAGFNLSFDIYGTRRNVNITKHSEQDECTAQNFVITRSGEAIDLNNFAIEVESVALKVEQRKVEVVLTTPDSKMYDGKAHDRVVKFIVYGEDGEVIAEQTFSSINGANGTGLSYLIAATNENLNFSFDGTRTNVQLTDSESNSFKIAEGYQISGGLADNDNYEFIGFEATAALDITQRPIKIVLDDSEDYYTGNALNRYYKIAYMNNEGEWVYVKGSEASFLAVAHGEQDADLETLLACSSQTMVYTVNGTKTNVYDGDDYYYITWEVIGADRADIDERNYVLEESDNEATLTVNKRPIKITLSADGKIYDGNYVDRYYEIVVSDAVKNSEVSKTKLTSGDETYGVEYAIECMAGFDLSFDIYGTRRNVNYTKHSEQNVCAVQNIVITRDGEKISEESLNGNFDIMFNSVALEVEQRKVEVVLTTPDSKMYDGKAHDRVVKFIVYGEDGEVIAEQTFSSINGANGTGLSYLIAATNENLNFSFDGTRTNYVLTSFEKDFYGIAAGYQISGGNADNDNYEFIGFEATAALHITPRPIKIVLDDSEDYYTGNALNRYYKIAYKDNDEKWVYVKGSADGFLAIAHGENDKDLEAALACSSQTMVYNVNGTKTNVYDGDGSYNITWEVIGADGADIDERNYVLEESDNEATLTVKPRPITITLSAEGKIYDGKYVQRYFEIYISDLVSPTSLGATRIESDKERENIGVDITCMSGFVVSFDVYGRRRNVEYMNHAEQNVCTVQNIVITRDGEKISEESFKGNFDINITSAALNVDKRQVKITLADMTATYNAKPLDRKFTIQELNNEGEWVTITKTVSKYTDEGFANELNYSFDISTVEGESITVVLSGIRTNVDKLTDDDYDTYEVDFKFVNALGEDADLENYDFSENDLEGSFTVEQRKIWISTEDGSKYYDGTPLVNLGSKYQEESQNEGLVEGEKLTVTVNGTETDANEGKVVPGNNTFTYTIFNGELDVHTNYSVEEQPGTLTVYRRRVQIILTNASKMYDGKALDRTYQFKVYATDEKGEFTLADAITIAHGESAENLEFVIPYITGEAETLNFSLEGTRTNVVLTASELDNFGIQKGYTISGGQGLKENYEFIDFDKSAALTVEHRPVKIELQDSKDTYDGFALDRYYRVYVATGYDQEGALIWADIANMGDAQWITVSHSDSDSGIYAMPYDGQSFNFKLVGTKTNVFDGDSQYSMDWNVTDTITGTKIEKSNFLITEGSAKLTVDPRSIWIQTDSNGKIYDGVALVDKDFDYETYYQKMEGNKGLLDGETINVVVNGTITNAGEATNTVSFTVAKGDGKTDSTGNYKLDESKLGKLTVDKRKIEVELTGAEKIYDGKAIDRVYKFIVYGEDDAIVSDDVQYTISDGMSGSYLTYAIGATGETLVFSLNGTRTNVVVTASESAKFGIAEGYLISGGQALNANYEFVGFDATADIKITARPIVIELGNSEAYYNGTYLDRYYKVSDNGELIVDWTTVTKADSETVKAVLSTDHTMTFTLSGRRTNVDPLSGDSDKYTTTNWSFTDDEDNAIAATNYAIDGGEATLIVKQRELYIEAIEKTVVYTGTYANRYFKVYYLGDDGETMYYASMDVGGNVSWVTDADAYCMLTSDYTSVENLIINCTGEIMSFEIDGSRINVSELGDGYGDKEYSIRTKSLIFAKSDGNDAKKTNYKTTWVDASADFNITKKKITSLHTEGNTWYYDGKAHTHPKVVAEGLVQGHKIDSTKTKFITVTNAGTYENSIDMDTISYLDKNGNPVDMRNYDLPAEPVWGELVILKLPIEIYSGSGKWFYQEGVENTNHGYWIHYNAGDNDNRVNNGTLTASADDKSIGTGIITLDTGDKLQLVIQGSITEVDSVSNVITYKFIPETEDDSEIEKIKDNYDIQLVPGILEVVPSQISIYLNNQEYKYDGKEHKYTGAGIDYSLYAGETFTASNGYTVEYIFEKDSLTLPGSIACRIKEFKISKNGEVIYHEIVATNEKSGNMAGNLIVDLEPDYYGILEVYDTFSFSLGRIEKMYTGSQISYSSQSESKYIKALEIADRHDYLRTEVISGTTYYIYDDWTTEDPDDYFAISFNLNLNVPAEHGSISYNSVNYWIESSGNTYDKYSYQVYRYASDGSRTNVSSYYRIKFEDPESEYLYVVAPRSITLTPVNKVIDANESYTEYLPYTSNDFTISSIEGNKSEFESNYIVEVVTDGRLYYDGEPTVANRIVEYVIYKVTRDADTKEVIGKQEVQRGIFDDYRYVDEGTFFKVTREDGTLIMNYGS